MPAVAAVPTLTPAGDAGHRMSRLHGVPANVRAARPSSVSWKARDTVRFARRSAFECFDLPTRTDREG